MRVNFAAEQCVKTAIVYLGGRRVDIQSTLTLSPGYQSDVDLSNLRRSNSVNPIYRHF